MNTEIINIDSAQFTNAFADFNLNREGPPYLFQPIKNVISIEISDLTFFYKSNGNSIGTSIGNIPEDAATHTGVTTSSLKFSDILYRFLTINDYERVTYNSNTTDNSRYTTKFLRNNNKDVLEPYPRLIEFNQPINLGNLKFSWFKEDGLQVGNIADLISNPDAADEQRFTFTLTIKSLHNSTLKNYNEMFNFSPEVLQRMAYTKMIENDNNKDMRLEDNKKIETNYEPNTEEPTNYSLLNDENPISLGGDYTSQTNQLNNQQQYFNNGNRINFDYNGFVNK